MAVDLETSLRLITDQLSLFELPWAFLRRNLSGKYRVTLLGGSGKPFDYLKREPNHRLEDGVYVASDNHLLHVPLLYTDVDLTDIFVANGNFRPGGFEALSYLTDRIQQVDSGPYALPASSLPASSTAPGPVLDVVGSTFSNTPPPISDYVARPKLESELLQLLTDDRHPVVTLAGRGGVGKTSLALEVLQRLAHAGEFFAILWFSARDIDLLEIGPRRVRPDVLTQRDIAKQFVELMDPAGSADREFDCDKFLADAMSGSSSDGPFLFVLDNFETVRDPVDVYNWMDSRIRLPNKILLTSRFREFRADYPIEVGGMSREEFRALATSTAHRLGVAHLLNERFLEDVYEESDGHPYVVKILLGEAVVRKDARSVERVIASREDILDALFERTFSVLSPAAQRVFLTLCSWRSAAPRLAGEAALLRPANERMDVGASLNDLERSSLIEIVGGSSMADQFVRVPVAAAVFGRRKIAVSSSKTAIEADAAILRSFGVIRPSQVGRGIGPRIDSLVRSLAVRAQGGENIADGIAILEFIGRNYPPAWLRLADLYDELPSAFGGVQKALDAVRHYLELDPEDIMGWRRLGDSCAKAGDAVGELHARVQVAESPQASMTDISIAATRFNALAAEGALGVGGDEKRAIAARLRDQLVRYQDEADGTTFSRLAWLALHLGDIEAAREYTVRGLSLERHNRHCRRLAERLGLDPDDDE